jgi:antirestriction protein
MNTTTATASAFFYIDGIPTKGTWIDLDESTTWEDIAAAIREKIPGAVIDEILCADAEGLARNFLSRYDCFSLGEWQTWSEAAARSYLDPEIVAAYCENLGDWTEEAVSNAEDNYSGSFDSPEDFAYDLAEQTGMLESVPENLRYYFDFEKFARDLLMGDYFENDGHYFHNC